VSKRAFCHSFDGKNDKVINECKDNHDQEMAESFVVKETENQRVYCEAKTCVSNENGYCIKHSIEVKNKDFGAKCISFMER
jgi:hypothetical protein